jgi:hypothetical protein
LPDKINTIIPLNLRDQVCDKLRVKLPLTGGGKVSFRSLPGHSFSGCIRTEHAYAGQIKCFIFLCGKRNPKNPGAEDVKLFHTRFTVAGKVFAQIQAKPALLFAYSNR